MGRITEIVTDFVNDQRHREALELMRAYAKSDDHLGNQIVLLSGQLNGANRDFDMGLTSNEERKRTVARIQHAMLGMLPELERIRKPNLEALEEFDAPKPDGDDGPAQEATAKKVLFLYASPANKGELRFSTEIRHIQNAFHKDPAFALETRGSVRPEEVLPLLREHKPQILHISSHSSISKGLLLEDQNRLEASLLPAHLADAVALAVRRGAPLELVLVNACNSRTHGEALKGVVPLAIGMDNFIPDEAAIEFTRAFYQSLAQEPNYEYAFEDAVLAVKLLRIEYDGQPAEKFPTLFKA